MSSQALAVPGPNLSPQDSLAERTAGATDGWPPLKIAAAALFARGYSTVRVYKTLQEMGVDGKKMRSRIRKWRREQAFLDTVWQLSLLDAELSAPTVVLAMLKKAQKGDVLAAKFFLELIGRYSPKPEAIQASVINLQLPESIQRPQYAPEVLQTDDAASLRAEVIDAK